MFSRLTGMLLYPPKLIDPSESETGYAIGVCTCNRTRYFKPGISNCHGACCSQRTHCFCIHCAIEVLIKTRYFEKIELCMRNKLNSRNHGVCGLLMGKVLTDYPHFLKPFVKSKKGYQRLIYIIWKDAANAFVAQCHNSNYCALLGLLMIRYFKPKHILWWLQMEQSIEILTLHLCSTKSPETCPLPSGSVALHFSFHYFRALKKYGLISEFVKFQRNHNDLFQKISAIFYQNNYGPTHIMLREKGAGAYGTYGKRVISERHKKEIWCGNPKCDKQYFEWKYGMEYYDDSPNTPDSRGSGKYLRPNDEHDCIWNRLRIHKWYICKGCKALYFCSRKCQKISWNRFNHKAQCLKLQKLCP